MTMREREMCGRNSGLYVSALFILAILATPCVLAQPTQLRLPVSHAKPGFLAACLLVRDAHADVRDWVEWHHWIGVEKVFLFDHNSSPPLYDQIADFISDGIVQYLYFQSDLPDATDFADSLLGRVRQQCFAQARGYWSWMLFTDVDEFAFVPNPEYNYSLSALLHEYPSAGAVLAHWRYFGSGGIQTRPPGSSLMATFTTAMPELNAHVKGIANLNATSVGANAHMFTYEPGFRGVRVGDDQPVWDTHRVDNPPANPPLVFLHYIGAVSEWEAQVSRFRDRHVTGRGGKQAAWYEHVNKAANTTYLDAKAAFGRMPRRPHPGGCVRPPTAAQGSAATAVAFFGRAAGAAIVTEGATSGADTGAARAVFTAGVEDTAGSPPPASEWRREWGMLAGAFAVMLVVALLVQRRRVTGWLGRRPRHG